MSRANLLAAALIAPLLVLVGASFAVPLLVTLYTAIGDPEVREALPRTAGIVRAWDGEGLPPEEAYAAIAAELGEAQEAQAIGALTRRLNFEQSGMRALLLKTARAKGSLEAPYKPALIALDARWGDAELWRMIRRASGMVTPLYVLRSVDLTLTPKG